MDFRFDLETERFRAEVRGFLADAMDDAREHVDPHDLTGLDAEYERALHRRAGERGWLQLSGERRAVFEYEVARADAPLIDTAMTLAGHAITSFGSTQHASLLEQMTKGATVGCIAYTEAGAGSDLTAIQTSAVPDGDGWTLSGRKVLVTAAPKADWCLTIARTEVDARPGGAFTMFVVDMRAPGVRVETRQTMNGWALGDIAFDDVRLSADAVVGEVGAGWRQMAAAVNAERSGMFWLGFAQHVLDLIVDHVRTGSRMGKPLVSDPIGRDAVARCAVAVAAVERLARRALWTTQTTATDPALNAMVKIASTELLQALAQTATELSGRAGTVWAPLFGAAPPGAAGGGRFAWEYVERVHGTISVGANELQRDTVAALALGVTGGRADMDLAFTSEQQRLADAARHALVSGGQPPLVEGALVDLAIVGRELGRAAGDHSFHAEVLARLLGWHGTEAVAVGLRAFDGVADFVGCAARATTFLLETSPTEVLILARGDVELTPQPTLADDDCCRVTFSPASAGDVLAVDVAGAVARAAVVLAADAVGAAEAALAAAVAHVTSRHQWGAPLAALQVVRHRCADMLLDVTVARDAVFDAAGVADRGADEDEVRLAAAFAMATAVERCRRVTAAAHQLAGGQGIDAEAPFHHWYRRVKCAESALGDMRSHREHIAASLLDTPR